ncbi:ribosomal-processing cysteine protease Prp ['Elaeagnus angustifolia' witches'-broom phytoplasma]|uniref:Ribosomal processing cysteine protease Prp n=1 Tax='Elaeagnus angustifolia' witches'-broom phytoplasma TaxID=1538355 RepID=A0ABS5VB67_9MOLU|nr:ribosomal-processing cysteine protease Prp ['Elaeagnus angustifolia' witches'-broom phytoplasma]MCX2955782.1 ribosomal-processing cysteine protease Prp [Candidatus Phytoplasma australiense]
MIRYCFYKEQKKITSIQVWGHALYAPKGFDILCASVSTAIIVTLNALEKLQFQTDITYNLQDKLFELEVKTNQNTVLFTLLDNLEYTICNLAKQYPNNFKKISQIQTRKRL